MALVQDQYGNYVIQHVLVNGRSEHKLTIVQKLKGKIRVYYLNIIIINRKKYTFLILILIFNFFFLGSYLELSKNKFGSNVVEKCVQFSGDNDRDMIIEEIVGSDQDW